MDLRRTAAVCGLLTALSAPAAAVDTAIKDDSLLQPYEPITAGYTKDSDDVPYMDVTLSLKLRLLPEDWLKENQLYLSFTGRFGFYWGTRFSSPVIGKSYNPKLFWRWTPGKTDPNNTRPSSVGSLPSVEYTQYFDFAYAHQSNGQTITTATQYEQEQKTQQRPQFANDYISRGWDYLEVIWKRSYGLSPSYPLSSYVDLKYFLNPGLLQGRPEEYKSFENDRQGKPRRAVDGLSGLLEYQFPCRCTGALQTFSNPSLWLKYQTGYDTPFRYGTERLEAGIRVAGLPLAVWAQYGYLSDLANYYRKVTSYGIELRVGQL